MTILMMTFHFSQTFCWLCSHIDVNAEILGNASFATDQSDAIRYPNHNVY